MQEEKTIQPLNVANFEKEMHNRNEVEPIRRIKTMPKENKTSEQKLPAIKNAVQQRNV